MKFKVHDLRFVWVSRYRMLFLPQFWLGEKFIRARLRVIEWKGFHLKVDNFDVGNAYRVWLGWILLTVLDWTPPSLVMKRTTEL